MTINRYFDHVYCLNLPECKERADMTLSRAQRFGLSFTLFPAVSGKLFSDVYRTFSSAKETTISNPNYMACALSHLSIYRHALAMGHRRILVIEDDLLFNKNMPQMFSDAVDEVPDDWKLLYLAWIPLSDDLRFWDYSVINDRFIGKSVFKARNLWSAMAYGIDSFMMEHLTSRYNRSFDKEIDRVFVEEIQTNFPCYGIDPQVFCGYDNYSNNTERNDSIFNKSFDSRRAMPEDYV
jgi:GR25 family glycosyltransferase involved in LPS biosynthesis